MKKPDLFLLARYVPRSLAEHLIRKGINFVDAVGNMSLKIGDTLNWTVIGLPDDKPVRHSVELQISSRAELQFLFYALDHGDSLFLPARKLSAAIGISKSSIANLRSSFLDGLLGEVDDDFRFCSPKEVLAKAVAGYAEVLRPKLILRRFRSPATTTRQHLLEQLKAHRNSIRYSLTGSAALEVLKFSPPGLDTTMFVADWSEIVEYNLRLEPDPQGQIVVLRAFGEMVFETVLEGHTLAPGSLIAAEAAASRNSP